MKSTEYKLIVSVTVSYDFNGKITPLEIMLEDGRRYSIDHAGKGRPGASLKAGGVGQYYPIRIKNQERILWYDELEGVWFVERKQT